MLWLASLWVAMTLINRTPVYSWSTPRFVRFVERRGPDAGLALLFVLCGTMAAAHVAVALVVWSTARAVVSLAF